MQNATAQEQTGISLTVNGESKSVRARTLRALLAELELEGEFFAIAVDRSVIPRARWHETTLKGGEQIEIVTPRQGG